MGTTTVIGKGLYRIPDAARLANIPLSTLRTWLKGYTSTYKDKRYTHPPRWMTQIDPSSSVVGFLDLVEARTIGLFRRAGVRWSTIIAARAAAKEKLDEDYPFATLRLLTNGRLIIHEVGESEHDRALVEITTSNRVFDPIMRPFFKQELDIEDEMAVRWWPLGKQHEVVLDPEKSFGKPIVASFGVPTRVLAAAVRGQGSEEAAARWFEVSLSAVKDAVEFERRLKAA